MGIYHKTKHWTRRVYREGVFSNESGLRDEGWSVESKKRCTRKGIRCSNDTLRLFENRAYRVLGVHNTGIVIQCNSSARNGVRKIKYVLLASAAVEI
jgi:hypothetical protein